MLLSQFTYINTNNRNYKKFIQIGYQFNIGDRIKVKTCELNTNSKELVEVECDVCHYIKKIKFCDYMKNISKYDIYTCSSKCSRVKSKKTCLLNFGYESPLQNQEVKENLLKYFTKTFGVKHPSKLNEFEIKKQNTNLERYNVKHQMYIKENINKIKTTKLNKYGDENYNNLEKSKNTKFIKYNDETFNNHDKCRETKLEKYNDEYYNNRELFIHNFLNTYGVVNPMHVAVFFQKQQVSGFSTKFYNDISYRGSYELDFIKYCELNNIKIHTPDSIEYIFNGVKHHYYPDFFIKEYNLICEIKSSYYYELYSDKNIAKKQYTEKSGYNFIFIIDKNYDELKKLISTNVSKCSSL